MAFTIRTKIKLGTLSPTTWLTGMCFLLLSTFALSQNLLPGDLAVLGVNANNQYCGGSTAEDHISFVCFKDIAPGTAIDLTDNGWERVNPGMFGNSEGTLHMIFNTGIPKGQVVTIVSYNNDNYSCLSHPGAISFTNVNNPPGFAMNMNSGGDQIFFMQGGTWNPGVQGQHNASYIGGNVLFGFSTSDWNVVPPGSSKESKLHPDVIPCYHMEPTTGQTDYLKYTGPMTAATQLEWINRIKNSGNWTAFSSCGAYNSAAPNYPQPITLEILPNEMSIACTSNCTGCAPLSSMLTFNMPGTGGPFNVVYSNGIQTNIVNGVTDGISLSIEHSSTTTYYLVSVTDQNGCPVYSNFEGEATFTIVSPPVLTGVGSNSPLCEGDDLFLTAPYTPDWTYSWTGPQGFTSNLANPTLLNVNVGMSGNYTLVVNAGGCSSQPVTVNVTVSPNPEASPASLQECGTAGAAVFNLTEANNAVNGNTGLPVNWFLDPSGLNAVPNPSNFTSNSTTVFAQVSSGACHSQIVSVSLEVLESAVNNLSPTLCSGNSLIVNGTVYNESNPVGTEVFPNGAASGCDSTVNVSLSFYPPASYNLNQTLCAGQSIIVNGLIFDEGNPSGLVTFPGAGYLHCDSIVNVNLSFYSPAIFNLNQTLCKGESIVVNGTAYNESNPTGTEVLGNGSYFGCDSIINVSLLFYQEAIFYLNQTLCTEESIVINGTTYNQSHPSGTEVLANANVNGCDSTVNVSLSFSPPSVFNLNQTLCEGESIIVNGTTYNQGHPSGTEILANADANGCDSTVNVSLDFYPLSSFNLNQTLCDGESISVNGLIFDQGNPVGTVTFPEGSYLGCDSVVNVSLSFFPPAIYNLNQTLCEGESVVVNGLIFDQGNSGGLVVFPGGSYLGCDSIVNVSLDFFPPAIYNLIQTLCEGASILVNGTAYNQGNPAGVEILENAGANGCDSTVNVSLSFYPAAVYNLNQALCPGESIAVNGLVFDESNPSGVVSLPAGSYFGCDSTVNVSLSFYQPAVYNLNQTLCAGGSIVVNGKVYDESNPTGTEFLPNASVHGCDSTIYVNLTFGSVATGLFTPTLCPGESVTIDGVLFDQSNPNGSIDYPNGSYLGCDSVLNVSLSFYLPAVFDLNQTLCDGESIIVNGTAYNQSHPIGTEVLQNAGAHGCDSTVNVSLNFYQLAVFNLNQTLCDGESIVINGTIYSESNPTGTEVLGNGSYFGCDSIINVGLFFYQEAIFYLNQTLCTGQSIVVNGTIYDEANPSGVELLVDGNYLGCDSTIIVNLTFNPSIVEQLSPALCAGESVAINGTVFNEANPSGSFFFPNGSFFGCDSTIEINLSFYPPAIFNLSQTLCTGGSITVNGTVYNEANPTGTEFIPNGGVNGCDSTVLVNLTFNSSAIELLSPTLCDGESITIDGVLFNQANPNGSFTYPNGSYFGCDSILNVSLSFYQPAVYNLNQTLCSGESISVNGTIYDETNPSGTEVLQNASAHGCDSTVLVSLTFNSSVVEQLSPTLCEGESVTVNGTVFNEANPNGTFFFPNGSFFGCDSTLEVSLSFFPPAIYNLNQTLCEGASILVNGTAYNQGNPAGVEILENAGANGCDSTVNVSLSFFPAAVYNLNQALCPGESIAVNGLVFDESNPSGVVSLPAGSYFGCDSTVNISLSFYQPAVYHLDQSLCTGGSIVVNGTLYDESNPTGTEFLPNASVHGCDSTIYVNLTFGAVATGLFTPTLCPGESVTIDGVLFDQSNPNGSIDYPNGSYLGCDSVLNVSLSFYLPAVFDLNQTLCDGESIIVNGTAYNQSHPIGTEVLQNAGAHGCDSTVNVSLNFYQLAVYNLNQALCPGESIIINGTAYSESNPTGTETLTGGSANGCDSIINVGLFFYQEAIFYLNQTLCTGQSIVVNGTIYDEANPSGVELLVDGNYLGCDSTIIVNLTFNPSIVEQLSPTLCAGESVAINGTVFDEANPSGSFFFPNGSFFGCDSTSEVSLSFFPAAVYNLNQALCPGESIAVNGLVFDESNPSGVVSLPAGSYFGCDSTVNISLSFYQPAVYHLDQSLCTGGSIVVNGTLYDESNPTGTELLPNASAHGCDSTIYVNLTFGAVATGLFTPTLCPGESVTIDGVLFDQSNPNGSIDYPNGSYLGCDSVLNVSLSFYLPAVFDLNQTLCDGESIIVNGTAYNQSHPIGTEVLQNAGAHGCDSTVNVSLNFYQPAAFNLNQTLCDGESIVINGTIYSESNPTGTEVLGNGSYFGCDSIINVSLFFYQEAIFYLNQTLCTGQSIVVNGTIYDEANPSGVELLVDGNYLGCDSTIIVNLTFNPSIVEQLSPTLCAGESVAINGTVFDEANPSGSFFFPNGSFFGCDSTLEVSLSFFPAAVYNLNQALCPGESIAVNGLVFDESNPSGVVSLPAGSYFGCDSTVNISLSFYQPAVYHLDQSLCTGGSIVVNGTLYDESNPTGTELLPNASAHGCDSTIYVNLTFGDVATGLFTPTLCPGESVTIDGVLFDQSNPNGSIDYPNGSYLGCDSVLNVSLSFYLPAVFDLNQTLCDGESIIVNGTAYNQSHPIGTEVLQNAGAHGCDSTVNVSLSFYPKAIFNLNQSLCTGGSIIVNGTVYDESHPDGIEVLQNGSAKGCDSTVVVSLTFNSVVVEELAAVLCDGESLAINGEIFDQANPSGSVTFPAGSYLGCDSVVNVSLSFYPEAIFNLNQSLCTGGSIIVNGTVYDESHPMGTEILSNLGANGCDSIINVSLIFSDIVVANFHPTLCPGDSVIINGVVYSALNPVGAEVFPGGSYLGCDSVLNIQLSFYPESVYHLSLTLQEGEEVVVNTVVYDYQNQNGVEVLSGASYTGCDSIVFILLTFTNEVHFDLVANSPLCQFGNDGSIVVNGIFGGTQPFVLALDGGNSAPVVSFPVAFSDLDAGFHTLTLVDASGEVYHQDVFIAEPPTLTIDLGGDQTVMLGEDVQLSVVTNFAPASWFWSPPDYLDCTDCPYPVVQKPFDDIAYTLLATDANGCSATGRVSILVEKIRQVFVPNAFSPNNDGINDELTVFAGPQVAKINSFKVFNRWGGLMYEYYNFSPNDLQFGWDGKFNGKLMDSGVYVWLAEVEFLDGQIEVFKGGATLMR